MQRLGEADRPDHLRADAAQREPRSGPVVRRSDGPVDRRARCGPANSSCWKARPTRRRRATSCCRFSSRPGSKSGRISSWPSAPSAKTRATRTTRPPRIPKVVGGLRSIAALASCSALRSTRWSKSCRSPSLEVAEACKILENTYRAVNIALVNELKMLYDRMGIDVWEVIDAAKTKPFGFQAFYPGPGPGRALHSDRSVLSDLAGPQARHDDAVHRTGRRDQHAHAGVRRRSRSPSS